MIPNQVTDIISLKTVLASQTSTPARHGKGIATHQCTELETRTVYRLRAWLDLSSTGNFRFECQTALLPAKGQQHVSFLREVLVTFGYPDLRMSFNHQTGDNRLNKLDTKGTTWNSFHRLIVE